MSIAGTIFLMVTVNLLGGTHGVLEAVPVLILAAYLVYAFRVRQRLPAIHEPTKQASKVIMWSSVGEGFGILVAINIVKNIGHPEWVVPAMALVVGLHFLPMAFAIPFKLFYVLGLTLIAGSIVGTLLSPAVGPVLSGLIASLGLWTASVLALRREASWA